jgi:concentrative nucleoside transporter, CNT family
MLGALALQGLLAVLIVRVPLVWDAVGLANSAVSAVEAGDAQGIGLYVRLPWRGANCPLR